MHIYTKQHVAHRARPALPARAAGRRTVRSRAQWISRMALLLALCLTWSFVVGPCAAAATISRPHFQGLYLSPVQNAKLVTAQHRVTAMCQRVQRPDFPYRQINDARRRHLLALPVGQITAPTLLDEVGLMARPILTAQVAGWHQELLTHPTPARAAVLQVWLGEWQLAHGQQPETAMAHFQAAQRLVPSASPVYGLAAFDRATAFFYAGAYSDAVTAFGHLLAVRPVLHGFDRRDASLWMRHAGACAGYHADRARAGIPEPPRLDPLCGAAALAASLRALGRPFDRETLLSHMHVTGEGSSIRDVADAAQRLGVHARLVRADDVGLRALPKPMVAYVEHDHFVSVVRADARGVSYLCSDCGPWPGGAVNLTWRQWHLLDGGLYVAVTRPGSSADHQLEDLKAASPRAAAVPQSAAAARPVRVAFAGPATGFLASLRHLSFPLRHLIPSALPAQVRPVQTSVDPILMAPARLGVALTALLPSLHEHVVLVNNPAYPAVCGNKPGSLHCPNCIICCLMMTLGLEPWGPAYGDPVNLATGEEEYKPQADLTVYNPVGPSVTWARLYNSLRRGGQGYVGDEAGDSDYEMNDFGVGWSRSYNVGVWDPTDGAAGGTQYVFFENGARVPFYAPAAPTAAEPQVQCSPEAGAPFLVTWCYAATGNYYTIEWPDRTQWVTTAAVGLAAPQLNGSSQPAGNAITFGYALSRIIDRNGNAITFNYGPSAGGVFSWPLLSSITNENGTALLTVARAGDGSGNIAAVYDCYGRSVLYHVSTYAVYSGTPVYTGRSFYSELDHVSELTATGAAPAADRYVYGYQNVGYGYAFLNQITVPNPAGGGTATATINYDPSTYFVTSAQDGNGYTSTLTSVTAGGSTPGSSGAPAAGSTLSVSASEPSNYTQVTVSGAGTSYTYTGGYDQNMNEALMTDGAGVVTSSETYNATSADPYRPTSVTNGNGNVTQYAFDQYGNVVQMVSPRGTVTNATYDYSQFQLGELVSEQTGAKAPTSYRYYEPSGLVKTVFTPLPGTVASSSAVTNSYIYDDLGNILTASTPGNNSASTITTTYNYNSDAGDNAHGVAAYNQSDAIGQPLTVTDNLGNVSHLRYDALGNMKSQIDPLGNEADFTYNIANQLLQTNFPATGEQGAGRSSTLNSYLYPDGPTTRTSASDESGTVIRQVNYIYGPEGELRVQSGSADVINCTYDALYRVTAVSDGNANTTHCYFDQQGYLDSVTFPGYAGPTPVYDSSSGTWSNITGGDSIRYPLYDSDGNNLKRIDGNGSETDYIYNDPESLLTGINYPASSSLNVNLSYDAYGRLVSRTDGTGAQSTNYDDDDLRISVVTTYSGLPVKTMGYSYFPDGILHIMTTPAGSFTSQYDAVNRLIQLTNANNETYSWQYLNNNWIWKQTLSNGAVTTYTYDARGNTTGLNNSPSGGSSFSNMGYDGVNDRTSLTATYSSGPAIYSGSASYKYDSSCELTQEQSTRNSGYTNAFGYDAAWNPTTFRGQAGSFNADNQKSGSTYDGNGNPTSFKGSTLTFGPENRLSSYSAAMSAGYSADNLRAWKQGAGGKAYYLYDLTDQPVCELNASGSVTATNTFGANGLLSRNTSSGSVFYNFDPQGNVAQRLDSSDNVLSDDLYDAFGSKVSTYSGNDPWGFGAQYGYYTDAETGLLLLVNRYYDPQTGRFLTRDPSNYTGGMNLYGYVRNNSLNRIDMFGLWPCKAGPNPGTQSPWPGSYGHHCGLYVITQPDPGYHVGNEDCIDNACRMHDNCQEGSDTWKRWIPGHRLLCDQELCYRAAACLASPSCNTWQCKVEVILITQYFCPIGSPGSFYRIPGPGRNHFPWAWMPPKPW